MILGAQLTSLVKHFLTSNKQRFPLGSARTARRSNAALSRRARRSSLGPSAATATKPSRRSWADAWQRCPTTVVPYRTSGRTGSIIPVGGEFIYPGLTLRYSLVSRLPLFYPLETIVLFLLSVVYSLLSLWGGIESDLKWPLGNQ